MPTQLRQGLTLRAKDGSPTFVDFRHGHDDVPQTEHVKMTVGASDITDDNDNDKDVGAGGRQQLDVNSAAVDIGAAPVHSS